MLSKYRFIFHLELKLYLKVEDEGAFRIIEGLVAESPLAWSELQENPTADKLTWQLLQFHF